MYINKTIPIIITNCTDRKRAFQIECLEFGGETPERIIGINDLTDVFSIDAWESHDLDIIVQPDDYFSDLTELYFVFKEIATGNRYVNAYKYSEDSEICKIDYSFVFIHDSFRERM